MGDLNNIQDEIYAEMSGDLADVSFDFTGKRLESIEPYDPDNPENMNKVNYSGKGIFGLTFNEKDSESFQIQVNDMKAIAFMNYTTDKPKIEDDITYRDGTFKIVNIVFLPADNGYTLQLRRV